QELDDYLAQLHHLPAETIDGYPIKLWVNTGVDNEFDKPLNAGAEGVGLYRTEIPFMTKERFPTEQEQYVLYRQLLNAFSPLPVTIRTLDIGGDKTLPYFPIKETNPFLGWRGIRISLDQPEILLTQFRALLRANIGLNNLRIKLPMISQVGEFDEASGLLNQVYYELKKQHDGIVLPPLGVMIEVPSAVYQAEALAKRADFFSIGTNDLTQYLLAVDRNNTRIANLYDSLHPAVLFAIKHTIDAAHHAGKTVSLCGEMSNDPVAIPLLLAMETDAISANTASILRIKWVIRRFSLSYAKQLLRECLLMESASEIRAHLEYALQRIGLGGLIRAGKF
ncbi:MAG: phosphoenolpyruvate-protein phosphotransferase PtsP, partial [Gammaproteobacteria bacterium]|nr:phosphoenolpyruvate-protein phosphotransferase PtsP [Gammaproteobacteria bacterium]